jgi:glycosyltransferase involved in cell wall biosynthesis/CelD/BcsL family acetyltransferase involved in cellulose biosynthesis
MIDELAVAGTESQMLALIRHLDRTRVQPFLCLLRGDSAASRALEPEDCPVLRLDVRSFRSPTVPLKAVRLARFLRQNQIDIFQVYFPESTYFGVPVARMAGVPHVITTFNNLGYWMTAGHRWLGRIVSRFASATITNCDACRQAVLSFYPGQRGPVVVVENGLDLRRFRDILPAPDGPRRIGMVANLRPVKDVALFVRAAALVAAAYPDVTFHVAGEGELRAALQAQARELGILERFHLPGLVADIPGFLAGLDVAVLCSRSEGLSNALLEYMAAGRPIVATSVGGNTELIEDGVHGLLIPPQDPHALADALLRLLKDPPQATRLGQAARQRVAERFGLEARARRVEAFYDDLVAYIPDREPLPSSDMRPQALTPMEFRPVSVAPCPNVTVAQSPDPAADAALYRKWQALSDANRNLYAQYSSPLWYEHVRRIYPEQPLHLAVARDQAGDVLGLMALRTRPLRLGFDVRSWRPAQLSFRLSYLMGNEVLLPPEAELYDQMLLAAGRQIRDGDGLYIHSLATDTFLWKHLHSSKLLRKQFCLYVPLGERPFHALSLPPTYAEFLARFGSRKRNALKRKVRLLREHGGGQFRLERVERADQVEHFVKNAAEVVAKCWQPEDVETLRSDPEQFRAKLTDLADQGLLRSYLLFCGEVPCAFILGYQFRDVYHYADPRYSQDFKAFSPGMVLVWLMVEDLFAHEPVRWVNFGMGDARYKQEFSDLHAHDASVLLLKRTLRNRVKVALHGSYCGLVRVHRACRGRLQGALPRLLGRLGIRWVASPARPSEVADASGEAH